MSVHYHTKPPFALLDSGDRQHSGRSTARIAAPHSSVQISWRPVSVCVCTHLLQPEWLLFAGAYFREQGVRYVCVAGAAVQGDRAAPRRSVQRYAHAAYTQVHAARTAVPVSLSSKVAARTHQSCAAHM